MAKKTEKTETPVAEKKKRGRKPGSKSPRNIFVTCVGVVDAELHVEEIMVKGDKSSADDELLEQAKKLFEAKHGELPEDTTVPYFQRKGQQSYRRKRDSLKIPVDELVFTRDRNVAEYNGWEVAVRYIEKRDDAAYIFFKHELVEGEKKKAKPPAKTVYRSALQNVRPFEESA
ncbi:MAG TPA: hypothetical protein VMW91_04150 [Desulfosporosinus sp.]|nr:hypothetical protein [Desulfosporosinus sp.]